jgi:hypothetical protein
MNMAVPVKGTLIGLITACGGMIAWSFKQRIIDLFHRGRKEKTLAIREPETNDL